MTRDPMKSEPLAQTLHGQMRSAARPVPAWRRRLAGLMAGALALSVVLASAMPVRADDTDDLVAALAALALLGVIIGEADNDRDDRPVDHDVHRPRPPHVSPIYPPHYGAIPASCAIEFEGRDRRLVVVYAESCLKRAGIGRLSPRCAREINYNRRHDWVYGAACLREEGYRLERTVRHEFERPN